MTSDEWVNQAIAHEAGHIVIGLAVCFPVPEMAVEIVREAGRTRLGNFITKSVEPSDEQIAQTPKFVLENYSLFLAGGLAGNNVAGTGTTDESLQSDRFALKRITTESLEEVAKKAEEIIRQRLPTFHSLIEKITERFLRLMNDSRRGSGRHTLLSTAELDAIYNGQSLPQ